MKKKIVITLLTAALVFSGCGNTDTTVNSSTEASETEISTVTEVSIETEVSTEADLSELESLGDVEVDENLFSVELTIPADYVGEATQDELNATAEENGYKSITLNEDGSATYVMTKSQHKEMMGELAQNITDSLTEMVGSEDYPNITKIEANDNFTSFTITTTSTELDLNEAFSVMIYYMYGGMYNIFNGTPVDNVHVDFVNADSGEIISSSDSKDAE